MNLRTILEAVKGALVVGRAALDAGKDIKPILTKVIAIATRGEHATQADVDELVALSDAWSAELQAAPKEEEA